MKPQRVYALAHKETLQILRDPRTLAILIVLPLFLLVLFGYAIDLDVEEVRVAVVDHDRSPESRELVSVLERTGYFTVQRYLADPAAAAELLDRERVDALLQIDPGFARAVLRGEPARPQVVIDGANALAGATIAGLFDLSLQAAERSLGSSAVAAPAGSGRAARNGASGFAAEKATAQVQLVVQTVYNPQLESTRFLVPGLIAVILVITAVVSTALAVVREKERGTMEQITASPLRSSELILGKCLPYAVISITVALVILLLGYLLFGIGIAGNPAALAAATLAFLFACLGLGLLLSTLASTQQAAFMLAVLATYLPSFLLSGFVFPIRNMPPPIQLVTRIVPARYYLEAVRRVMIKGGGFPSVAGEIAFLSAFALLTAVVAGRRLRRPQLKR